MFKKSIYKYIGIACLTLVYTACKVPALQGRAENRSVPAGYNDTHDSTNSATLGWKDYFTDPYLVALIDTALKNNQELNITLQEIGIARNEIRARKGEYLPFVGLRAGAGFDKAGKYTLQGATEEAVDVKEGTGTPDPLQDYLVAACATWEVDIWHKLHNAKKAAVTRYLSTIEGRNFVITTLIAEIANSYYELLALDNQLDIVQKNITIQNNALEIVRLLKTGTRVTELAVRKFEAEVLNTTNLQYGIRQKITETENRINFLLGRYPQHIQRNAQSFDSLALNVVHAGIPSQLLANRPDIKQAELDIAAAGLDLKVARARFYPSLDITASVGYQAFNPAYLLETPASLLYSLTGDLVAPLVNRNAIKAAYFSANARQVQTVYNYERSLIKAYMEVANQLSMIGNLQKSFDLKSKEVETLTRSIDISNDLFKSARADYMEVLMTQRDALESKFELVETKKQQLNAMVNIYQALGGGWK